MIPSYLIKIACFVFTAGCIQCKTHEALLFEELFDNRITTPQARPIYNKSNAIDVRFNIAYVQIVGLDDRDQSLKSNLWIRQFWKNEFLTWDPEKYGGVKEIVVDKKYVWKPDIVLYNSADSSLNGQLDQHKTRIKLRYDGENIWYIPAILISGCSINIKYFPFDYQRCELKFGSWSYLGPELNLISTREDIDLDSYQESYQFWLIGTKAVRNAVYYSCCPDPFIDITFSLVIHRQAGYYVFNVIMPSFVLTFFALFIFAYPEPTGERMGLAIQCFLTISILTMMVSDMLPVDSNVTPLLASFMLSCITAMTMSIVMNTVCLNLDQVVPVPAWLHDLVFNKVGPAVMWRSCIKSITKRGMCNPFALCDGVFAAVVRRKLDDKSKEEEEERFLNELKDEFYKEFNERYNTPEEYIQNASSTILNHQEFSAFQRVKREPYDPMKIFTDLPLNEITRLVHENKVDARNLKILVDRVEGDIEGENTAEFWRCFSQTIDRLFLLIFTLVYITVIILLFLYVPKDNLIL